MKPCIHLQRAGQPVRLYPTLSLHYLRGSKFDDIENPCGIVIDSFIETFAPALATEPCAYHLKLKEDALLLQLTSLALSTEREYLDFSVIYMSPRKYRVKYPMKRNKIL